MTCTRYQPPELFDPFRTLAHRAHITAADARQYFGVSVRTFRRWCADDSAPIMARRLLVYRFGDLGPVCEGWEHWRFVFDPETGRPELWTPEDLAVTPGDIRALPWLLALAHNKKGEKVTALPPSADLPLRDLSRRR